MKLLVIGSGGREHALAWRLAQSQKVQRVFVAPGNAGTATEPGLQNVALQSIDALVAFAIRENVHCTVVGPEAPLSAGIVDAFRAKGLKIFGPSKAAAQLESSKSFAKRFMARHHIPTAHFETFTDASAAHSYVVSRGAPIVVKADGLAAGKGVVVAATPAEAHSAIDAILASGRTTAGGGKLVIEEFLEGEEASFIVMCDGKNALALASSQDHKRLREGDQGPNTGGMGAYSPAPVVTPEIHARAMREVIMPTLHGMANEGILYTGFLYAGLMIDAGGAIKVLEFNCRLGDPEAQPIMMRLKSDLLDLTDAAIAGRLEQAEASWDRRFSLGVVMAAAGYPEAPRKGDVISGLSYTGDDFHVFHAGTRLDDLNVVTNGGRVLCVTALGDTVKIAHKRAYEIADAIYFDGMQMRRDIGHRAIHPRKS